MKLSMSHACSVDIFVDYNIQVSLRPVACLQCRQGDVFAVSVFQNDKALFKRSDIYEFLSLYLILLFLLFYFRTYTYPLPVSASLSLPVKLVFCFLSSQCVRLTQRGMKSIFYVSYSRKSPPSSRLSLCSGPVIMKVN